jgi:hypothetical protein
MYVYLAVRAKGYRPRVVVTDLRVDYHDLIAQVFPQAIHHECIFAFLEGHWPRLVNAINSHLIPTTNNATE